MKYLIIVSALLLSVSGAAQSIQREAVSSVGGFSDRTDIQISWTVGEVVVVTAFSTDLNMTQGFQQPDDELLVSIAEPASVIALNAWPNPTQGLLTIQIENARELELELIVYDLMGRMVVQPARLQTSSQLLIYNVDLSQVAPGYYFVKLADKAREFCETIEVQKY